MAEESAGDKTEAPSDKRRSDSRQKGSVAKSQEVSSVIILLVGILAIKIFGPWIFRELAAYFHTCIGLMHDPHLGQAEFALLVRDMLILSIKLILPIAGGILIAGVISNIVQVGFLFTTQPLVPSFSKINPLAGFKRLFSPQSLVELAKNIFKLTIVSTVAYITITSHFEKFLLLSFSSVGFIWLFLLKEAYDIVMNIILALVAIAILDFWFQRFEHERKLKMSKQELKDERKQSDGDPAVKGRIRSMQREMARRRMIQEVPKATVVVTNPTHIAIALRYEPETMKAPLVLAKGKRLIAQKIKEVAIASGIPIVEDKPLARAMYDKIDVGTEIPVEFFTAVAEILAYVFRLKNRMAA